MTRYTTLIADDESNSRNWLIELLAEHKDIQITTQSSSGSDALDHLRARNYDLAFLDISMPGRTGLEICKELQRQEKRCPWIIFVTAFLNHGTEAWNLGAVDYLVKPVSEQRLAQALTRFRQFHALSNPDFTAQNDEALTNTREEQEERYITRFGLTAKEAEICKLVAQGKLHDDIRQELALSAPTLKTHFSHIYQKTGLSDTENNKGSDKFARLLYLLFTHKS